MSDPVAMDYRFEPGTTRTYQVTNSLHSRFELFAKVANPVTTRSVERQIVFDQHVDHIMDDGRATLTLTLRNVQLRVRSTGTGENDAEMEKAGQAMLAPMIGKSFTVIVNKVGEVQKVIGFEAIQKAIMETQKNTLDRDAAEKQFDEYFFAQLQLNAQPVLTEDALEIGEKWPFIDQVPLEPEKKRLVRVMYYQLTGIKEHLASLDITGKLTLQTRTGLPIENRPSILELLKGDIGGSAVFDIKLGCFRSVRAQTDLSIKATPSVPGQPNQRNMGVTDSRTITEATLLK